MQPLNATISLLEFQVVTVYEDKEVQEATLGSRERIATDCQTEGGTGFGFNEQDSENFWRHALRIGGGILGLVGAALLLFSNPIGWAFVNVGGIAGILSGFFFCNKIFTFKSLRRHLQQPQKTPTLKPPSRQHQQMGEIRKESFWEL